MFFEQRLLAGELLHELLEAFLARPVESHTCQAEVAQGVLEELALLGIERARLAVQDLLVSALQRLVLPSSVWYSLTRGRHAL